ncbi:hypothetical protein HMPREF9946_02202 [Acetobacteraceae bacterium AT-5844]|nr:hypothetical protein HMPREF9946_02202 [Acetobacteraceae bacterium AT-5844]
MPAPIVDEAAAALSGVKRRGFASMTPERRREIASLGGKSIPAEKRAFSVNRKVAADAGRKGGLNVAPGKRSFARDAELASAAGRKGGTAAQAKKQGRNGA